MKMSGYGEEHHQQYINSFLSGGGGVVNDYLTCCCCLHYVLVVCATAAAAAKKKMGKGCTYPMIFMIVFVSGPRRPTNHTTDRLFLFSFKVNNPKVLYPSSSC